MKTERSYHPQNRFETNRRLLALPHKIIWLAWIVVAIVALKVIGAYPKNIEQKNGALSACQ